MTKKGKSVQNRFARIFSFIANYLQKNFSISLTKLFSFSIIKKLSRCSAGGSAPVSGTGSREFESRHFDQKSTMVLIQNHRAFSLSKKPCDTRLFDALAQYISFIISKFTARELKLEDLNPHIYDAYISQRNFS